jgi:phosphatidylserine/phosphatidylglycerophosphate/cardiolipin synthase-like enzyme
MKLHKPIRIYFLILACLPGVLQTGCSPVHASLAQMRVVAATLPPDAPIRVYFTDPEAAQSATYTGGPDQVLAQAIDRARLSVEMAAYSLNLWSIRDALLRAQRRGVQVRLVMESDNMDDSEVQDLLAAGIPIVGDQREGLMHDKFVILDRTEVWTGSLNYTVGGAYRDNNNLVRIQSPDAARRYAAEFDRMYSLGFFGPEKPVDPLRVELDLDGTPLEFFFSPQGGTAPHLVALIRGARTSIHFLAFSFTSDALGEAILDRYRLGVRVFGVMDDSQVKSNPGTEFDRFRQAGADVRLDGNVHGLMHHKVIIIDERIVVTGSYNFTNSAEELNDENLIVIDDPGLAALFLEEFRRIYAEAVP